MFAFVFNALALIRLRLTQRTNLRGDPADEFLVRPANYDLISGRSVKLDAFRRLNNDRMLKTQRQVQVFPLFDGTIADAVNF